MAVFRRFLIVVAVFGVSGCSGGEHSIFGATNPSGNVIVTMSGSTVPLSTSQSAPQLITSTGFSVQIHEDHYPSGFDAKVLSYTSGTTVPCWVITVDQSHQPNIATFLPADVPIPNQSGFSACPWRGDLEAIRFVDQRGNSTTQYFLTR